MIIDQWSLKTAVLYRLITKCDILTLVIAVIRIYIRIISMYKDALCHCAQAVAFKLFEQVICIFMGGE